jgi:hypothetical protein
MILKKITFIGKMKAGKGYSSKNSLPVTGNAHPVYFELLKGCSRKNRPVF